MIKGRLAEALYFPYQKEGGKYAVSRAHPDKWFNVRVERGGEIDGYRKYKILVSAKLMQDVDTNTVFKPVVSKAKIGFNGHLTIAGMQQLLDGLHTIDSYVLIMPNEFFEQSSKLCVKLLAESILDVIITAYDHIQGFGLEKRVVD